MLQIELWNAVRHGKSAGSAPTPPDPAATAQAQAAANKEAVRESALVNQVNQVTPYGNLTYTGEVGQPSRTATQTLAPDQQQMLNLTNQAGIKFGEAANQQLGAVQEKLGQPIDYSSLGAAPEANEATRNATLSAMLARMEPQFQSDEESLRTRLANQGISDSNSEAFRGEFEVFNRAKNDARLAADAQAGSEMARMFGLESASRDRAVNEMVQQRSIPLNELAAMLSGTQVQAPQFVNTGGYNVAPADIMGATYANYNGQNQAYGMKSQAAAAGNQGTTALIGTAAMAGAMAIF